MDRKEFFHAVFNGLQDAYGVQYTTSEKNARGKVSGRIKIIRENVTPFDRDWETLIMSPHHKPPLQSLKALRSLILFYVFP